MIRNVIVMYGVAGGALGIGVFLLQKLRDPTLDEGRTYAFRIVGMMLAALGIALGMSATAMWSWSVET